MNMTQSSQRTLKKTKATDDDFILFPTVR